jgi:hypothetical protein
MFVEPVRVAGSRVGGEEPVKSAASLFVSRPLSDQAMSLRRVIPATDATRMLKPSISMQTDDASASSKPATFITISRPGGHSMVPPVDATPQKGIRSSGIENPAGSE